MKKIATLMGTIAVVLAVAGCNTWSGVKQDAKQAGQATGKGIEKAGEKIQQVSQ